MKRAIRNRIVGQWKQLEGEVRTRWGKLSSQDFQRIGGRRDKLAMVLDQRYGFGIDEAQRQVDEWAAKLSFK